MSLHQPINHQSWSNSTGKCKSLKKSFDLLGTYPLKVAFYDQHFGVIPFEFPSFDPALSWYHSESEFLNLVSIVDKERTRSIELYERQFYENGETITFSIKPASESQKLFFNQYIFQKLMTGMLDVKKELYHLGGTEKDSIAFIKNKLDLAEALLVKIKGQSGKPGESLLRTRFMSIFYKGYVDYHSGNEKIFKVKRKFIELFLMSQGFLFADYMHQLNEQLEFLSREKNNEMQDGLKERINVLNELGVIRFLGKKIRRNKQNNYEHKLAEWICRITSADPGNHLTLVHKYLADIQAFRL